MLSLSLVREGSFVSSKAAASPSPGRRRVSSSHSLSEAALASPANIRRSVASAAPISTDDWASMLLTLPPVSISVAASPGYAVGLAHARHLNVSVSSSSNGGSAARAQKVRAHDAPTAENALLRIGDVLIALNGVPTTDMDTEAVAQKLFRLCHMNGTWVTVARPRGPVVRKPRA